MFSYRKRLTLIMLAMLVLLALGLHSTFYTMKKTTQWPVNNLFSFNREGEVYQIEILGEHYCLEKESTVNQIRTWLEGLATETKESFNSIYEGTREYSQKGYHYFKKWIDNVKHTNGVL